MSLNQYETPIIQQLQLLVNQIDVPFYAPGHKQGRGISPILSKFLGKEIFRADLPELPELDNLFAPSGVIAAAQQLAAEAFGARKTWFLVNGSTCGVIAAILATCQSGDKIILPRNIHQSAIAGLILTGAIPIFLQPEYNPNLDLVTTITPETVAKALQKHPDAKAVMVVYPTYQGICTDLQRIAEITHNYNLPLLVDEAHGAHFNFHQNLPPTAMDLGADLTVQSTHKVLGAMTQAAMLHLNSDRIAPESITQALQLVQSTSPSYLLLASLDAARQQMATTGEKLLSETIKISQIAKQKLENLPELTILTSQHLPSKYQLDITRLTVFLSNINLSGFLADRILRQEYGVTAELPLEKSLTFIITIGNNREDIEKLVTAFTQLVKAYPHQSENTPIFSPYLPEITLPSISPREAYFAAKIRQPLDASIGKINAELICPYPPGIPVLMPGETITENAIAYLQQVINCGGEVTGCSDTTLETMLVINDIGS